LLLASAAKLPAAVDVALALALLAAFISVAFALSVRGPAPDDRETTGGG
jgi:hypothetical protein